MSEHAIEVKDLRRSFGHVHAVQGVSFNIDKGDVIGFIGANGAGKTTTMRIMATLESPDEGHVKILGRDVGTNPKEVREVLGWMPDAFGRYTHMSVSEYLDFFARTFRLKGKERSYRIKEVAEFTELDIIRNHQVATLSKGQSQRLSLARTLLNDPDVLILDEPAAGLDPKARVELKKLIRLLSDQGKTLFISSHILSELDEICDSMLFINAGEIVYHGDSDSLKKHHDEKALIEIRALGDINALLAWIESNPHIELDRQDEDRCYVYLEDYEPETQHEVLKQIIHANIPVISYTLVERKLEDAFIHKLQTHSSSNS